MDILQDPTRIFNGNKSHFKFFPKTAEFLACKGDKNMCEVDAGLTRASITAVFAFSASGIICPSMLIYPYERIPSEITP
jgi:hypothetical protein